MILFQVSKIKVWQPHACLRPLDVFSHDRQVLLGVGSLFRSSGTMSSKLQNIHDRTNRFRKWFRHLFPDKTKRETFLQKKPPRMQSALHFTQLLCQRRDRDCRAITEITSFPYHFWEQHSKVSLRCVSESVLRAEAMFVQIVKRETARSIPTLHPAGTSCIRLLYPFWKSHAQCIKLRTQVSDRLPREMLPTSLKNKMFMTESTVHRHRQDVFSKWSK